MGDNFKVLVAADGRATFEAAFSLACGSKRATHYKTFAGDKNKSASLLLFWAKPESSIAAVSEMPFPMSGTALANFVWAWLEQASYTSEPAHDGDNERGFLLITGEDWYGVIDGSHYALLKVFTHWQMYGK